MKAGTTEKWIVCRVCLKQPNEPMQTIFDNCGGEEDEDLTQMMHDCGGVPIKRYDHFPDKICTKCLRCLRLAYKFRVTCQKSHNHLSRFIAPVVEEREETEHDEMVAAVEAASATAAAAAAAASELTETTDVILEAEECNMIPFKEEPIETDRIKQEYSEEEDLESEILEMYEPIEFEMEISEEILDSSRPESPITDDIEFLEDFVIATSDEEYLPSTKSHSVKKNAKSKTTKQSPKTALQKPTTSRRAAAKTGGIIDKKGKGRKLKEGFYICDVCGNTYPSQGRLTEHLKLHKGIKPHDCEICGHAFAQTQQLARHMNTHTGNRPYKCQYCPAAFADLSTRNKHHRIHTNERPYVCDVCGKAFTYTNTLKFHKMIHTGEKPHVCEICGKGFQQAYKLRNHRNTHERKGIRLEKIKVEMDGYPEATVATAHILEI